MAMLELSFLAAEVFRFVSNGCEFGPAHCHVCGSMSGLAQCHSAVSQHGRKLKTIGFLTLSAFILYADGVLATLPKYSETHVLVDLMELKH